MPTYDFECEPCAYHTEIKQGFEDPSTLECPKCGEQSLKKIFITAPQMFVRGEPTTIGHQAHRNTENMSKMELEAKREGDKFTKKVSSEVSKKRESQRAIMSMTPEQQTHYIKTGEIKKG
jgi:putative FmdB family regulatory protein